MAAKKKAATKRKASKSRKPRGKAAIPAVAQETVSPEPALATEAPTVDVQKPKPAKASKRKARTLVAADYFAALRKEEESDYAWYSDELAHIRPVTEYVPTGSLALDRLCGGGWPIGRISEIAAWEGVGKTTIMDQSIAMALAAGIVPCLIETEQGRDKEYSRKLGVDLERVIVPGSVETAEDVFRVIDQVLDVQAAKQRDAAKGGAQVAPLLLMWDSLAATPTRAELAGEAEDKHMGVMARLVKQSFRRLNQQLTERRAALVFSNHFYKTMGTGMSTLVTYGGSGPRYMCSLRVWLTFKGKLKMTIDKEQREIGHVIEAKLKKTRLTAPQPPVEIGLIYGAGVHNAYTLYDWGKSHGWIEQKGAQSYLIRQGTGEVTSFKHTYLGLGEILQNEPEVYGAMVGDYRNGA